MAINFGLAGRVELACSRDFSLLHGFRYRISYHSKPMANNKSPPNTKIMSSLTQALDTSVPSFQPTGDYDHKAEVQAFDNLKLGVQGLVEAGITNVPRIFHQDTKTFPHNQSSPVIFPVIDLEGLDRDATSRRKIVEEIGKASEVYGFFQVVNHGIPIDVMNEMFEGVRKFHEQDPEERKKLYVRDETKRFAYNSNFDLFSTSSANWRDSLRCRMTPFPPNPEEFPQICRDIIMVYTQHTLKFRDVLFELLSEALGLERDHLSQMGVGKGLFLLGHFYPACPEPDLTIGTTPHTDAGFITMVMQDKVGGLQVLYEDQWHDVKPLDGALVINIADLLQLVTNNKFKSRTHRVLAQKMGPRISVAALFREHYGETIATKFGPIKELLSEDNPPIYREATVKDFVSYRFMKGLAATSPLDNFLI
ncbi:1-aminocyclopropane-1-carboxylate oxidase homolog 11-like [Impatiens glandulifera]|uniref:1-aminocyclopropane-1-carboxylate oxidase homolog 11-like n=1 Tax=Impatiens glandulifera TaxID=253017 RepID=UPI001FB0AE19|nr:1-aminocyclopropane-1-carboxylate oxidase homolog 11-like [Impatiens glandulifera]